MSRSMRPDIPKPHPITAAELEDVLIQAPYYGTLDIFSAPTNEEAVRAVKHFFSKRGERVEEQVLISVIHRLRNERFSEKHLTT